MSAEIIGERRDPRSVEVVQPGASNVYRVGREEMGPDQCTLLSQRGLIALLETAAVRHASENAWNELRVIHEAESVEHLILFAEIDVQPAVKGVAVFRQIR